MTAPLISDATLAKIVRLALGIDSRANLPIAIGEIASIDWLMAEQRAHAEVAPLLRRALAAIDENAKLIAERDKALAQAAESERRLERAYERRDKAWDALRAQIGRAPRYVCSACGVIDSEHDTACSAPPDGEHRCEIR